MSQALPAIVTVKAVETVIIRILQKTFNYRDKKDTPVPYLGNGTLEVRRIRITKRSCANGPILYDDWEIKVSVTRSDPSSFAILIEYRANWDAIVLILSDNIEEQLAEAAKKLWPDITVSWTINTQKYY